MAKDPWKYSLRIQSSKIAATERGGDHFDPNLLRQWGTHLDFLYHQGLPGSPCHRSFAGDDLWTFGAGVRHYLLCADPKIEESSDLLYPSVSLSVCDCACKVECNARCAAVPLYR
uniref:Alcohol dehydrogenase-like 6 n=1 Tax=Rhizophora mucronata TaxID=61149 RepID=A0A2P2JUG3_RHIMU